MNRSKLLSLAALAIAAAIAAAYYFWNPASSEWAPKCAFHALTGLDCPGCGSQRMLHALLHGDFRSAWSANPFMICALPVIALMLWSASARTRFPRLYALLNSPAAIVSAVVLLTGWTIARNLI